MGRSAARAQLEPGLTRIVDLPERIAALRGAARDRADRLLHVTRVTARTAPPPELDGWLAATFGSVEAVREQTVVKVTNRATLDGTVFAPLRARRPVDGPTTPDVAAEIAAAEGDAFCSPETNTPADTFGRIHGARMTTGANAAAADAHHAVIIFDRHDPLDFDGALIADLLATGRTWAEAASASDPAASRYLLIWNCGWRAGGSIIHGHAQALLGPPPHAARLERLRRDADTYSGDLVADLVELHRDVGLARDAAAGVSVLAHLTPVKERELLVVGGVGMDEREPAFAEAVAAALLAYRDRLGVRSFNLVLWRPPIADGAGWEWLPPIARIVDRGDPARRPSDIGALELYATPVVGSDPYEVIAAIG